MAAIPPSPSSVNCRRGVGVAGITTGGNRHWLFGNRHLGDRYRFYSYRRHTVVGDVRYASCS